MKRFLAIALLLVSFLAMSASLASAQRVKTERLLPRLRQAPRALVVRIFARDGFRPQRLFGHCRSCR